MNKFKLLLVVFSMIILMGCQAETTYPPITLYRPTTYRPTTASLEDTGLALFSEAKVTDKAQNFNINSDELKLYNKIDHSETYLYVDIEDFLACIDPIIIDYDILKEDELVLSYDFERYDFDYQISFNSEENSINFNNFDYFLFTSSVDEFEDSNIEVISINEVRGQIEKTIYLDDYDMEIIKGDHHYYMPLYLANLILTSDFVNVYYYDNEVFIYDDISKMDNSFGNDLSDFEEKEAMIIKETSDYTALLLDHFYGLSDIKGISSGESIITQLGLNELTNLASFDTTLIQFLISNLNDPHTDFYDYGYYSEEISFPHINQETKIFDIYHDLMLYDYENINYDIDFQDDLFIVDGQLNDQDFYYLDIVNFNMANEDYLLSVINKEDLDPDKPFIIDLRKNTGGLVKTMIDMLTYLTNEDITLNLLNSETGTLTSTTYRAKEERKLDNQFIVLVSQASYSAANLFTSYVIDHDLATVIGTKTSGGAAIVSQTTLPNNMVISYSSSLLFLNQNFELIEDGVKADINLGVWEDVSAFYDVFEEALDYRFSVFCSYQFESNHLTFNLNFINDDFNYSLNGVTIKIYDISQGSGTGQLIYETNLTGSDIVLESDFDPIYNRFKIEVFLDANFISHQYTYFLGEWVVK